MSLDRSNSLEVALEEFDRLTFDRFPHVFAALRPPVAEAALDDFADEFGLPLPDGFRRLYRWHDGMDLLQAPHRTRDPLPGLGHWSPLVVLPSQCLAWQESWPEGFNPAWIPITWINEGALVIDASSEPGPPAPVRKVTVEGVDSSAQSIHELFDQLNGVIRSGSWAAGAAPNGADGWAEDPAAEDFSIFDIHPVDFDVPAREPEQRFALKRRFPLHELGTAILDHSIAEVARRIDELIDLAIVDVGRDALLLRPVRLSLPRLLDGAPGHARRRLREHLDLIGRILAQHLPPERWSEQLADAEAILWASGD